MSKRSGGRAVELARAKRSQEVLNVFLSMQSRPLRQRLRLARLLVFQSDLRHFARKQGKTISQLLRK